MNLFFIGKGENENCKALFADKIRIKKSLKKIAKRY